MSAIVPLKTLDIESLYTHPKLMEQLKQSMFKDGVESLVDLAILIDAASVIPDREQQQTAFHILYTMYVKEEDMWKIIKVADDASETIKKGLMAQSSLPTTFNADLFMTLKKNIEIQIQSYLDKFIKEQEGKFSNIVDFMVKKLEKDLKTKPDQGESS